MPTEKDEPQRPGEMQVQYGTRSGNLRMAPVNNELLIDDGEVSDAELEAYINRVVFGIGGDDSVTNRDTHPLLG